jgi:hypothetical protein
MSDKDYTINSAVRQSFSYRGIAGENTNKKLRKPPIGKDEQNLLEIGESCLNSNIYSNTRVFGAAADLVFFWQAIENDRAQRTSERDSVIILHFGQR